MSGWMANEGNLRHIDDLLQQRNLLANMRGVPVEARRQGSLFGGVA